MKNKPELQDRKNYIPFKFTIAIDDGRECETSPTPAVFLPLYGQNKSFKITGIKVYQGNKGEELFTQFIPVSSQVPQQEEWDWSKEVEKEDDKQFTPKPQQEEGCKHEWRQIIDPWSSNGSGYRTRFYCIKCLEVAKL